jgi:hypothetical protein
MFIRNHPAASAITKPIITRIVRAMSNGFAGLHFNPEMPAAYNPDINACEFFKDINAA